MKTYIIPETTVVEIHIENIVAASLEGVNEKGDGIQLTREQSQHNHGFGGGLWEDMK